MGEGYLGPDVGCREPLGLPRGHSSLPPCPQLLVPVTTLSSLPQPRAVHAKYKEGVIQRVALPGSPVGLSLRRDRGSQSYHVLVCSTSLLHFFNTLLTGWPPSKTLTPKVSDSTFEES